MKKNEIEIRKYKESDIPGFYEAVIDSKKEISKWLPWCHDNYSVDETKKWIKEIVPKIWESKKGCEFIIVNLKSNKIIGGCCLEQINAVKKEANIGYWVRTGETKNGIATQACNFLIQFGLEELELNTIKVIPSELNEASRRVAEKLPYHKIVKIKNGFQIREKISNALVYLITEESYKDRRD